MSWRTEKDSHEGRAQFFSLGEHPQRRHYWGTPKVNYGFYTSDQMEEVNQKRIVMRTESDELERRQKGKKKNGLSASRGAEELFCTCSNNPFRYSVGVEPCEFCKQSLSNKYYPRFNTDLQQEEDSLNPQELEIRTQWKKNYLADKSVQIDIKLPAINKHNSRRPENCKACKYREQNAKGGGRAQRGVGQGEFQQKRGRRRLRRFHF